MCVQQHEIEKASQMYVMTPVPFATIKEFTKTNQKQEQERNSNKSLIAL